MTHVYKKIAVTPQPHGARPSRHSNFRKLRKRMDRIDRRRLNRLIEV